MPHAPENAKYHMEMYPSIQDDSHQDSYNNMFSKKSF